LLGVFFYREDGGDIFLQNVGCLSTDYPAPISERIELLRYPPVHVLLFRIVEATDRPTAATEDTPLNLAVYITFAESFTNYWKCEREGAKNICTYQA
jgi:hypothetical protein